MSKPAPHELAILRDVYTAIVDAPWFNRNAVTEKELLKMIFRAHADGIGDHEAFGKLCRDEAQRRFSRTN